MRTLVTAAVAGLGFALCGAARAQQAPAISGAYVGPGQTCLDLFEFRKGKVSFKEPRDPFSTAFLIQGRSLRTPMATCHIARRTSGRNEVIILDLRCTNMMSSAPAKAYLRRGDDGGLVRLSGPDETGGSPYKRCTP